MSSVSTLAQMTELFTLAECSANNGNHNVHCTVHAPGITDINCFVANPTTSGINNVGDCITNNGIHLTCVIQQGDLPCTGIVAGAVENSVNITGKSIHIHNGDSNDGHIEKN